ncbi:hypothetical protein [Gaetbulibacter aestuarii]|uniref:Uncharacterized protein n=1 Tax=Gaetbulibacter aestuarii TaxID=1502358 RepID=A0ABW7MZW0_9FLAO
MNKTEIISLGNLVYDQRDISPAQLGITSRQINYWVDNKIIPFVEKLDSDKKPSKEKEILSEILEDDKKKWIRLNLAQAVWVCIVKELLSFGVSVKKLKKLAKSVWEKPRKQRYADNVFKHYIENKSISSEEIRDLLNSYLKDELIMEHYFRTIINPFTDLIKSAILREKLPHSMLYVPETNTHEFHMRDEDLILKLGTTYLENPLICFPIIPIIGKVLSVDFYNTKKDLPYLNHTERQVRDIVAFKKPKVVYLAFEDEHIKPITITEQHKTREQLSRYILENKIAKGSKLLIEIRSQDNYKLTLMKK